MSSYNINILHLYPDLLNLYGDKGNIECLKRRLVWRGIDVSITECAANDTVDISDTDIIFLGGGADREIKLVANLLLDKKDAITDFVENGGTMLALCSGYPLVGKSLVFENKTINGLGIVDITTRTDNKEKRLTGNVLLECEGITQKIVGFENHISRTDIGNVKPFGKVVKGFGNDGKSGFEGIIYKNLIGTYLHGPLLPKNPELCDRIIFNTLKRKYADFSGLEPLNDELEITANKFMEKRI